MSVRWLAMTPVPPCCARDRRARSSGCAGTARGRRSRRSLSWTSDGAHRVPAQAAVARRSHRARDAAGRVLCAMRDHGDVQRGVRTGREGPRQATRARARVRRRRCSTVLAQGCGTTYGLAGCRGPTCFAACSLTAPVAVVAASSRWSPIRRSPAPCSWRSTSRTNRRRSPRRATPEVELAWDDPAQSRTELGLERRPCARVPL